jgi:hypothetical protein
MVQSPQRRKIGNGRMGCACVPGSEG